MARALLRAVLTVVVLVVLYYILPLARPRGLSDALTITIGTVAFVSLATMHVKGIMHATYPVLRAVEALSVLVPLFILGFAGLYYVMSSGHPSDFSTSLTRTDSLYFTVTVFSTVGFGDIVAKSDAARIVVMVQMIADLVVIGVLARLIVTAAQQRRTVLVATPVAPADGATTTTVATTTETTTTEGARHAGLPADR